MPKKFCFCAYCGSLARLTKDNIIPKSRLDAYTQIVGNILLVCGICNVMKTNLTLSEWLETLPENAVQKIYVPRFLTMIPSEINNFLKLQVQTNKKFIRSSPLIKDNLKILLKPNIPN